MISSTSITDSLYLQCFELLWWYVNVLAWTYFYYLALSRTLDFPGSSTGKESTCNAGDTGSIPGSGRSSGEGIGYPLQCSWWLPPPVFLVATPSSIPGGSDGKKSACNVGDLASIPWLGRSPAGEHATHSSILAWRMPMNRGAWRVIVHGVTKSWTWLSDSAQSSTGPWKLITSDNGIFKKLFFHVIAHSAFFLFSRILLFGHCTFFALLLPFLCPPLFHFLLYF